MTESGLSQTDLVKVSTLKLPLYFVFAVSTSFQVLKKYMVVKIPCFAKGPLA